jgi:uncharacterized membrane protein
MTPTDIIYVLKWFTFFLLVSAAFLPLTLSLFDNFKDKGYIFSKIIGLSFITYFVFLFGTLTILKFTEITVYFSLFFFFAANYLYLLWKKQNILTLVKSHIKIFLFEELLFLGGLIFWSYVRGNFPEIHGLEKYMDFGFINSALRSDYFPVKDMWYTPFSVNYYYFGHLVTAVFTKLTSIPSNITYNLMLATLFGFTITASLSIVVNLLNNVKFTLKTSIGGLISAVFISLGGNLTTIYTFFKAYPNEHPVPFWKLAFLPFTFPNSFWYPNATRFIPFTIHEFPIYSFVVSDLHGHVLDIPFVLLAIALIFSYMNKAKITLFHLLLYSFLLAVMYMTNAWDGVIYFLLGIAFLSFINFYKEKKISIKLADLKKFFTGFFTILIGFFAFSLPFSLFFKPFVSGIGILCAPEFLTKIQKFGPFLFEAGHCQKSPFWQLIILYGAFYFFVFSFLIFINLKKKYSLTKSDIFVLILIALSTILLVIPEFIYVKDIYPAHYRANTMFKLSYEAFMMLSLCSGYIFIKLISGINRRKLMIPFFVLSLITLSLVFIYPVFAINSYYRDLKVYEGLNGTDYLRDYFGDYDVIKWINKNIKGQPVILEGVGDSYTDYARISTNTGLPTILGWPVHEWLWRGTYDIVGPRVTEVETLYNTSDLKVAKDLIKKYKVEYIVVGELERTKYSQLDEKKFDSLGKLIYRSDASKLYKVN